MTLHIDVQNATDEDLAFTHQELTDWALLALRDFKQQAELTLRLVNAEEMVHLNTVYRKQNKVTNVLAFPSDLPEAIQLEHPFLGDIVICPSVLLDESKTLKKELKEHWALIIIHGVLHLLGYDHIEDEDAAKMQAIEVKLLSELGYNNPYDIEE